MRLNPVSNHISSEINKIENNRKSEAQNKVKTSHSKGKDSTVFSSNGQRLSETKAEIDVVETQMSAEPEIRTEKVEEVKQKIKDGYYNSPAFLDKLAEKLISDFGLNQLE